MSKSTSKKSKRFSIKAKILIMTIVLEFISMSVLGVAILNVAIPEVEKNLNSRYESDARYYASVLDEWVLQTQGSIDTEVAIIVSLPKERRIGITPIIENMANANDAIGMAYVQFADGQLINSAQWVPDQGWDGRTRAWYTNAKSAGGEIIYSEPYLDDNTGMLCVTISKYFNQNGVEGVAAMDIYTDVMFSKIDNLIEERGKEGEYLIVTTENGNILYHPNKEFMPSTQNPEVGLDTLLNGDYSKNMNTGEKIEDYDGTSVMLTDGTASYTKWNVVYVSPMKYYKEFINRTNNISFIVYVICMVVTVVVAIAIGRVVSKPIMQISRQINEITGDINDGHGDLTKRISSKAKDEIKDVADGLNNFIITLQKIIGKVKSTTDDIKESNVAIVNDINDINNESSTISGITEELAASMQMVSSYSNNMSSSAQEVLATVEQLVNETENNSSCVEEMKSRSTEVKELVGQKTAETSRMVEEKNAILSAAIEKSKSVEDISTLAEEILEIASQTNLLALNASIEAARAGDAGRGFAVVANSIRELADSSKETANNIQIISNGVITAVEELMESAQELISMMNQMIEEDYSKFEEVGVNYYEDSERVQELLNSFANSCVAVHSEVEKITAGITDVNSTISECSKGINEVANSTNNLVATISGVKESSDINSIKMDDLTKETASFTKL